MHARGMSRNGLLLLILGTCAVLAVLNLLLLPPPRLAGGSSGGRGGPGDPGQATLTAPGGAGSLAAAPGSDPASRQAREEARRAAAAAAAFPRSEGVFGYVLDGKGAPVRDATVLLMTLSKDDLVLRGVPAPDPAPVASTKSGADGSFLVGPAPEGTLRLRAEAEGYAPTVQQVAHRGTRVDLTLDRGGELRVRALDAEGTPVADAQVVHHSGTVVTTAVTGPDGRALFPSVPTGQGSLLVTKEGHGAARRPEVAVAPGVTLEVTVLLGRPLVLSGRVVGGAGDRPVADASVRLVYPYFTAAAPPDPVTTGPDGAFRFEVPAPHGEQLMLEATAEGEGVGRTWTNVTDNGSGTLEVIVKIAAEGTRLAGRVVDARGQPVEGALVTLAWQQPGTKTPEARTDGDGAFELPLPPGTQPGSWWQVVALSETLGMGGAQARLPPKPDDRMEPIVLTLSGSGSVRGRVTREGQPVEGALVSLSIDWGLMRAQRGRSNTNWMLMNLLQDPRRAAALSAVSGEDGTFALAGVPASTFRATASHGMDSTTVPEPVVVGPGGTAEVEIALGQGLTIEGVVVDDAGNPVAGAWVNANLQAGRDGGGGRYVGARSQSDGTFVLRGLSDGSWHLQAWAAGFMSQPVAPQTPGSRGVTVRLVALGWIEGVLEEGGRPYRGPFSVAATQAMEGGKGREEMWSGGNEQSYNTDDGRFELRGLGSGSWTLSARTPDGRITRQPVRVDVMNGRGTTGVALALALGATITGVVTNEETGRPVGGASVHAAPRRGDGEGPATGAGGATDASGRFTVRGLAPGTYLLHVNPPNGVNWQEEVELREGETKDLRLVERAPGKVRVYVVDADRAPLGGAQPVLTNAAGGQAWPSWQALQSEGLVDLRSGGDPWQRILQTDGSGVNLRHHVPPGRYQVTANLAGWVMAGEAPWIEVASGRTTEVTVVLQRAEAPAEGR